MSLGIFVEGPSDRQVIPVLIRKLGYGASVDTRVVPRGRMLDPERMAGHIDALIGTAGRPSQILVFIDSEGVDPETTRRETEPVARSLAKRTGGVPVEYIVVDHSLEGWLACDTDALKAVLGGSATIRIRENPEDHPRPAELLKRVFRENGRSFKKTVHNLRIAEHVEPDNIRQRSPTFRRLAAAIGGS